jgi:hypothetical protein
MAGSLTDQAIDLFDRVGRRYRSVEERPISAETWVRCNDPEPCRSWSKLRSRASSPDRTTRLDARLATIDMRAADGTLTGVTIDKRVLKITPIEKLTLSDTPGWR